MHEGMEKMQCLFLKQVSSVLRGIFQCLWESLIYTPVFPIVMYGCESWAIKNAEHGRIVAFELWYWKRLLSPLGCKEVQLVHPQGNQSWIFIERTEVEAETPVLWPPDVKNWLIGKDPDAGKDWRQEEKGTIEEQIVWWHDWLDGHDFERVGDGQGSLACCSPWAHRVRHDCVTKLKLM